MERYYFDVYEGEIYFEDKVGIVIDYDSIAEETNNILRFLTCERIPYEKPPVFMIEVRNETGQVVYISDMHLVRNHTRKMGRLQPVDDM